MKKKIFLLGILLFTVVILISNTDLVGAHDDDGDHIDDDFEKLNIREFEIDLKSNEIEITSLLKTGENVDEIEFQILYNTDGIEFQVSYNSEYNSGEENHFEVEFSTTFKKLTEFIDINGNGMFDPISDNILQEIALNSFKPAIYSKEAISSQTFLHKITLNTTDDLFSLKMYFTEEFILKNDTLLIPMKPKIDIEINSFPFINESSNLALYISLDANENYEKHLETEDETYGYAVDEEELSTFQNQFTGIFSWVNSCQVDGFDNKVNSTALDTDDYSSDKQKMYLIYPQGIHIFHDPKIGLEGIFRVVSEPFPWLILIITSTLIGVGVSVTVPYYYYYRKKQSVNKEIRSESVIIDEDLTDLKNKDLTIFSEEFLKTINTFEWDPNEKDAFINEMSALKPRERMNILKEMLDKSKT
jgi:hypothetical protein